MIRNFFALSVLAFLVAIPAVGQTEWTGFSTQSIFPQAGWSTAIELVVLDQCGGDLAAVSTADDRQWALIQVPNGTVVKRGAYLAKAAYVGEMRVALCNGTFAVGYPDLGRVEVRRRNGGSWPTNPTYVLTGTEGFGESLAFSPNGVTLAIGNPIGECGSHATGGSVHLYQAVNGAAIASRCALPGTSGNGTLFGDSVAFGHDGCLRVGQPGFVGGMSYKLCPGAWATTLLMEGHENGARQGTRVATWGDFEAASAPWATREGAQPSQSGVVAVCYNTNCSSLLVGEHTAGDELGKTGLACLVDVDEVAVCWASVNRGRGEVAKWKAWPAGSSAEQIEVHPTGLGVDAQWGFSLDANHTWFAGTAPGHFNDDGSFGAVYFAPHDFVVDGAGILFSDGFESGDLSAWSSSSS